MTTIPVKPAAVPPSQAVAVNPTANPPAGNPTVAKSIARPDAFSKAGTMGKASAPAGKQQGMRFRPLKYQRGPGRPRKKARDVRSVIYY
jgi:hypothetical protein